MAVRSGWGIEAVARKMLLRKNFLQTCQGFVYFCYMIWSFGDECKLATSLLSVLPFDSEEHVVTGLYVLRVLAQVFVEVLFLSLFGFLMSSLGFWDHLGEPLLPLMFEVERFVILRGRE